MDASMIIKSEEIGLFKGGSNLELLKMDIKAMQNTEQMACKLANGGKECWGHEKFQMQCLRTEKRRIEWNFEGGSKCPMWNSNVKRDYCYEQCIIIIMGVDSM